MWCVIYVHDFCFFFFSSRRRHTRLQGDWSSDVCSSDLRGELYLDALLVGESQLLVLFSFARAYFFVDMEVPAAYVSFLRWLMPKTPRAEIYMAVGLAKQGKTLFYRDLHYHLRHSSDRFVVAPGIKGLG